MYEIKQAVHDIRNAAKRRRALLILTPLIFLGISFAVLHTIEPKYMSSTSILVQKDETLNPLILYEMAVNIASEDRLKSFNEIIYSRSTMEMLIDSLHLDNDIKREYERQGLIDRVRRNISTSSRASDSFEISFYDTDPVRARDAVSLLANHFITTRLLLENRRNSETVNFFTQKLGELESIVDAQRNQVMTITADRLKDYPSDVEALQTRLLAIETQLESLEWQIFQEEQKMAILREFQENGQSIQVLFKLPLTETPFGTELLALLNEYEQLSQQFTETYPRLRTLSSQIILIAQRIPAALELNLERLNNQKNDLDSQKSEVVSNMQNSFVATQRANTRQSDFGIYESLFNDMKIKLEQAKITRDIGSRRSEQFIVLDPPYIPEKPASPKKRLILGAGFGIGILFGVMLSAAAEVMDTRIRAEEDLPFDKPVIAYLTNG